MQPNQHSITFIDPILIHEFNSLLKARKFVAAKILFSEIKEEYSPIAQTAFIKLFYLNYVGINKPITNFLHQEFTQFNLFSPISDKCYSWSTQKHQLEQIYRQENISKTLLPHSSIELIGRENKIPLISHYAWVTSSEFSEQEREAKFWQNNKYLESKLSTIPDYQHIIWVNDLKLIPPSVLAKLSKIKIEMKTIADLYQISVPSANNENLLFLLHLAQIAAELKFFAISTDIIRYQALKEIGGIYSDGDYQLYQDPQKLFKDYEAVLGYESVDVPASFNGFYAVKNQHPVMIEILKLTARNILAEDSPHYSKYGCYQSDKTYLNAGIPLFSTAVQRAFNQTSDLLLPDGIIVHSHNSCDAKAIPGVGIIGSDDFSQSWKVHAKTDYSDISYFRLFLEFFL